MLSWLWKNVAIVTSLSSIVIAACSLVFTINAQRQDIEYKEASILPRLAFGPVGSSLAIILTNSGPGSAVIRRVVFQSDGRCLTSDGDEAQWQRNFTEFVNNTVVGIYAGALANLKFEKSTMLNIEVSPPQPESIVRSGEELVMFRPNDNMLKKLSVVDGDALALAKSNFALMGYTIPIAFKYCSITETKCFHVGGRICSKELYAP